MLRFISLLLITILSLVLSACGGGEPGDTGKNSSGPITTAAADGTKYVLSAPSFNPSTLSATQAITVISVTLQNLTKNSFENGATLSATSSCSTQTTPKATISNLIFVGNGLYQATYTNYACTGTDTITVTGSVSGTTLASTHGDLTISAVPTSPIQLGMSNGTTFTTGNFTATQTAIASNGTATLNFNLWNTQTNTAYTTDASGSITLNSTCAATGKTTFGTVTYLGNGAYSASYTDTGCTATSDTITATATVNNLATTATATITITPVRLGYYNGSSFTANTVNTPVAVATNGSATLKFNLWNTLANSAYSTAPTSINVVSSCGATLVTTAGLNGAYSIGYTDNGCTQATDTVTVTAVVNGLTLTDTATITLAPVKIGSYNGTTFTAGTLIATPSSITTNGSTQISLNLWNVATNSPYTTDAIAAISFSSGCMTMGKAIVGTVTNNGSGNYTATYTNNGCAITSDTISATATINGLATSASVPLTITSASSSSTIQLGYYDITSFIPNVIYGGGSSTNITANTSTTLRVNLWDTTNSKAYATDVSSTLSFLAQCQLLGKATISNPTYLGNGVYTLTYTDAGCTLTNAQNTISATAIVNGQNTNVATTTLGTTAATTATLQMGSCTNNASCTTGTFTASTLKPATAPLSAGGQTTINGVLFDTAGNYYNSLTQITLSSTCATSVKATISNTSATNGQFSAVYKDNGCASTDTITATATVNGTNLTASTALVVAADTAGSIQFVSATPTSIAVKGSGLTEQSVVKFQVIGASTTVPVSGQTVNFSLSTTAGGVSISPTSATSDNNGYVTTTVSSGTTPTPVSVLASTGSVSTQSNTLSISTTRPDQPHFSMAAAEPNKVGTWDTQGTSTTIGVLLADQFSNPPPAGTTVNFQAESGQITPSCVTDAVGTCTVTWTTQTSNTNPPLPYDGTTSGGANCYALPTNLSNLNNKNQNCVNKAGRVTIMAYVSGSEGFIDNNNDGIFNDGDTFATTPANYAIPPVSLSDFFYYDRRDLEPPFCDFNYNFIKDSANGSSGIPNDYEVPNTQLTPSDYTGKYNGVLCSRTDNSCSTQKSIYIFRNMEIVMPTRGAKMSFWSNNTTQQTTTITSAGNYKVLIQDNNGNTMSDGTTVNITASTSSTNLTVSSTSITVDKQTGYGHVVDFIVSRTDPTQPATGAVQVDVTSGGVTTTRTLAVSI